MTTVKCAKHGKHPFVNSRSCAALIFWDTVLFPKSCSRWGRLPCFWGLLLFLWHDIKFPVLSLFSCVVDQCWVNKMFNWDDCHCGLVLELDGRNQSSPAPSVRQEKTQKIYILPETKWDLLFSFCQDLINFICFQFACFNIKGVYHLRCSVKYIFHYDWFEGCRMKFGCRDTNWLLWLVSFAQKLDDIVYDMERCARKRFWVMVTLVTDKCDRRWRLDIFRYKRSFFTFSSENEVSTLFTSS